MKVYIITDADIARLRGYMGHRASVDAVERWVIEIEGPASDVAVTPDPPEASQQGDGDGSGD